jgi:hypothetical protein
MNHRTSITLLSGWLLLASAPAHSAFSQTTAIPATPAFGALTGKVSDDATGSGLQGASVRMEGTAYETYTDERGEFRLPRVPSGIQRIVVSYLGYTSTSASVSVPAGGMVERDIGIASTAFATSGPRRATRLLQI